MKAYSQALTDQAGLDGNHGQCTDWPQISLHPTESQIKYNVPQLHAHDKAVYIACYRPTSFLRVYIIVKNRMAPFFETIRLILISLICYVSLTENGTLRWIFEGLNIFCTKLHKSYRPSSYFVTILL